MSKDSVRLICPSLRCRAVLAVPAHARGKTVRCRQCGTRVKVPINQPTTDEQAQKAEQAAPADKD